MSKHDLDEMGTRGYFLPEDSHFRLKKLHEHMVFLSQLAQPRTHDEDETGWGPQISGGELAVCLEQLADQAERVLDEATWPAERVANRKSSQAGDEAEAPEDSPQTVEAAEAGLEDEEADEEAADAAEANAEDRLVFGMTMDQLDTLNRLHDRLHAYGDLLFGVERIDLADGTLTMLGDAIFEEAEAASDLMDKVAGQALPDASRRRNRVREAPAIYGVPASPDLTRDAAMPMLPPPADAGWRPQAATRH
ncbi:hypothetical protein QFW77_05880 [Luteimonas sp. RD2P54]|uniref:XAC0095-like domain-containing protein n=1 Tax=Luteimonas endophytica TaxID=3042023 RepID=A0ABT6J6S2_9GAMM|nr:hypothetical protein [Luteimonas endophytica]MDH5822519.1 hypothetical protein [Luteimonas endophytica]